MVEKRGRGGGSDDVDGGGCMGAIVVEECIMSDLGVACEERSSVSPCQGHTSKPKRPPAPTQSRKPQPRTALPPSRTMHMYVQLFHSKSSPEGEEHTV